MKKIFVLVVLLFVSVFSFSENFTYFGKVLAIGIMPKEAGFSGEYDELRIFIERDDVLPPNNKFWYFYRVHNSDAIGLTKLATFYSLVLNAQKENKTIVIGVANIGVPAEANGVILYIGQNYPGSGHE